jgi:hypothetical protein
VANSIFDRMMQLADMPRADRDAPGLAPDVSAETKGHKILEILMPALERVLQSRDALESERDATRLMLALEVYRGRRGAYPETLDALAPDILGAIPLDAVTGKRFGYKRLGEPDEHGRGYLLYSFASDGIDNDGHMGERTPPTPFLTGGQTGLDFVYNQPRGKPAPPRPAPAPAPEEPAYEYRIGTPGSPQEPR